MFYKVYKGTSLGGEADDYCSLPDLYLISEVNIMILF